MKVLFVSDIFYPHTGGVPEHILYLCKTLREMGHEAKILAPSYGNNYPWVDDYIIRLGRAIKVPKNRSFSVLTFGILIPWKLRRLLARENFDVIHLHGSVAPTLPYLALKYSKAKNFITFHSAHEKSYGYVLWEPVLEQYFRKLDGLIAVSTVARNSVSKYFPGQYRIIPNGIDLSEYEYLLPKGSFKKEIGLPDNSRIILYLGRLHRTKRIDLLLRAFAYLNKIMRRTNKVFLIIAGPDDGYLPSINRMVTEQKIGDSVLRTGFLGKKDKIKDEIKIKVIKKDKNHPLN